MADRTFLALPLQYVLRWRSRHDGWVQCAKESTTWKCPGPGSSPTQGRMAIRSTHPTTLQPSDARPESSLLLDEAYQAGCNAASRHLLGRSTPGKRDSQPFGARHRLASRVQTTTKQRSGALPAPGFPGNGHVVDRARPQTSWSTCHGAGASLLLRFAEPLDTAMEDFDITTVPRPAMFLAQCAHESALFRHVTENLSYSSADRLRQVFSVFRRLDPLPYVNQPEKLANLVYANKLGRSIYSSL
jgi:hypothetical protein